MGRVLERTLSRIVALVIAAFAGFLLLLETVFSGATWVDRMSLVAWALLPFFFVAMAFVVYFENRGDEVQKGETQPDPSRFSAR